MPSSRVTALSLLVPFPDEVQAIATLIEKQAQIVVKPRVVTEEQRQRKAALLAQYAEVTDEEEYPCLWLSDLYFLFLPL